MKRFLPAAFGLVALLSPAKAYRIPHDSNLVFTQSPTQHTGLISSQIEPDRLAHGDLGVYVVAYYGCDNTREDTLYPLAVVDGQTVTFCSIDAMNCRENDLFSFERGLDDQTCVDIWRTYGPFAADLRRFVKSPTKRRMFTHPGLELFFFQDATRMYPVHSDNPYSQKLIDFSGKNFLK